MARILHSINILLISWHFISASPIILERTKHEKTTLEKILLSRPNLSITRATSIARSIDRHCGRHLGDLCISILFVESSFRPTAISATGDVGLGQLSPGLRAEYRVEESRALEIDYNIRFVAKTLKSKARWYHYHSRTKKFYVPYKRKVQEAWKKIQEKELVK